LAARRKLKLLSRDLMSIQVVIRQCLLLIKEHPGDWAPVVGGDMPNLVVDEAGHGVFGRKKLAYNTS
jgi:hypothetical protein